MKINTSNYNIRQDGHHNSALTCRISTKQSTDEPGNEIIREISNLKLDVWAWERANTGVKLWYFEQTT